MLVKTAPTIADVFRPATTNATLAYEIMLIVAGSVLIAASARVEIPLPYTLVPITGQTFAILLIAALFGARRGAATVLAYLAEGAAGLPVFAGGAAGVFHLFGPTGGYLLGFVPAAFIVGWLAQRGWDRRFSTSALAMIIGTLVLFIPGLIWYSFFVGPQNVLAAGLLPYIPGAIVKIALATALLPAGWKALNWLRP